MFKCHALEVLTGAKCQPSPLTLNGVAAVLTQKASGKEQSKRLIHVLISFVDLIFFISVRKCLCLLLRLMSTFVQKICRLFCFFLHLVILFSSTTGRISRLTQVC